jgi:hypothetical protein
MNSIDFKWVLISSAIIFSVVLIGVTVREYQIYECKIAGIQKGLLATDIDTICKKK